MEVKYWILSGVVSVFFTLFLLIFRVWLNRVLVKFDKLTESVNEMKLSFVAQKKDAEQNSKDIERHEDRLNDHDDRLKTLEIKAAKK